LLTLFCRKRKTGKIKLTGYNTDAAAFETSLKPYLKLQHNKALILGSGVSSKAIQLVLKKLGKSLVSDNIMSKILPEA